MLKFVLAILGLVCAGAASAQAPTCPARLFVSGYFSTVHIYDACTGAYLRDLDGNARIAGAQAVKLGPDGLIYVVSEMKQQSLRYRNDTLAFVDVFATIPGADPTGFAFAPNGDVYVAAFRTNDVRRLSAAGVALGVAVVKGAAGLHGPDNGITFAADGNLYIPGYYSSSVVRFDPRTGQSGIAVPRAGGGLALARGLLPTRDGQGLLITGEGSGQLLRLDFGSGTVSALNSKLLGPTGLEYGVDGGLLVLEDSMVRRLDPATGAMLETLLDDATHIKGGTFLAVIAYTPAQPAAVPVVEYYNGGLDHYFMSALPADIAALDSGDLKGWMRTGHTFNAYPAAVAGTDAVCRFYLPPVHGDSHFYSASAQECAEVEAKFPNFVLEAADVMHIALPDTVTGGCPPATVAVFRLWNNRADSNHRYTADPAVRDAMLAKGYVAEGYGPDAAIMCAPV